MHEPGTCVSPGEPACATRCRAGSVAWTSHPRRPTRPCHDAAAPLRLSARPSYSDFSTISRSIREHPLVLPAGTRVLTGHCDGGAEAGAYDDWIARGH